MSDKSHFNWDWPDIETLGIIAGILIALSIAFQGGLTIYVKSFETFPALELYCRNISSILTLFVLCIFLFRYNLFHIFGDDYMDSMTKTSVILAVACFLKAVVTGVFIYKYIMTNNLIFIYYISELIVWLALGCFAVAYAKRISQ